MPRVLVCIQTVGTGLSPSTTGQSFLSGLGSLGGVGGSRKVQKDLRVWAQEAALSLPQSRICDLTRFQELHREAHRTTATAAPDTHSCCSVLLAPPGLPSLRGCPRLPDRMEPALSWLAGCWGLFPPSTALHFLGPRPSARRTEYAINEGTG